MCSGWTWRSPRGGPGWSPSFCLHSKYKDEGSQDLAAPFLTMTEAARLCLTQHRPRVQLLALGAAQACAAAVWRLRTAVRKGTRISGRCVWSCLLATPALFQLGRLQGCPTLPGEPAPRQGTSVAPDAAAVPQDCLPLAPRPPPLCLGFLQYSHRSAPADTPDSPISRGPGVALQPLQELSMPRQLSHTSWPLLPVPAATPTPRMANTFPSWSRPAQLP